MWCIHTPHIMKNKKNNNPLSKLGFAQNEAKIYEILVEGTSKKSVDFLQGRTSENRVVVFPKKGIEKEKSFFRVFA